MSLSEEELKTESTFRVGEKVYYIRDGFVWEDHVRAVFKRRHGDISYHFDQYTDEFENLYVVDESMVFKTKAALIKSL